MVNVETIITIACAISSTACAAFAIRKARETRESVKRIEQLRGRK